MDTSAGAAALEAAVATYSNLSPDRLAAKLESAVAVAVQALGAAGDGAQRTRDKAGKFAALARSVASDVDAADAAVEAAESVLAQANAALTHHREVNG